MRLLLSIIFSLSLYSFFSQVQAMESEDAQKFDELKSHEKFTQLDRYRKKLTTSSQGNYNLAIPYFKKRLSVFNSSMDQTDEDIFEQCANRLASEPSIENAYKAVKLLTYYGHNVRSFSHNFLISNECFIETKEMLHHLIKYFKAPEEYTLECSPTTSKILEAKVCFFAYKNGLECENMNNDQLLAHAAALGHEKAQRVQALPPLKLSPLDADDLVHMLAKFALDIKKTQ